ncbi:MAG: polysaccharide biosynthesis C-terminal domain-containing protein [Thermoflavifilum sp.]|nr:polysaccharide biosynthesis C-terminal domain-containing protein [Thermoflavifilum sp.]
MQFGGHIRDNLIGRLAYLCVQMAFMLGLIRLLGPKYNGVFTLLVTNAALCVLLIGQGIDAAMIYDVSRQLRPFAERLHMLLGVGLLQLVILCGVSVLYAWITGMSLFGFSTFWGCIYAASLLANQYGMAFLFAAKRFRAVYWILCIGYGMALLCLYVWNHISHQVTGYWGIVYAIWVNLATGLSLMGYALWIHRAQWRWRGIRFRLPAHSIWHFGQLAFWANVFQYLAYRVDIWMVDLFLGKTSLGIYAVSAKLIQMLWVIPTSIATVVFAYADRVEEQQWQSEYDRWLRVVGLGVWIVDVFLFFTAYFWIKWFLGSAFVGATKPFLILLPGASLFVWNILLAAYFSAQNKVWMNVINSACCFMIIALLDWWWIPRFGIEGAAWASSIGYAYSGCWAWWMLYKTDSFRALRLLRWPKKEVQQIVHALLR